MEPDFESFWKKYSLVSSTDLLIPVKPDARQCRYCKLSEPVVSFQQTAHVIPELLGRNSFICFDECDTCNKRFSSYESHLSKYFQPFLTITGVRGKKGVGIFQSRTVEGNEKTRTVIKVESGRREVSLRSLDDYIVDRINKTVTLNFRRPPHIPFLVYKAMVKIAIGLVPTELLKDFDNVCQWLLTDAYTLFFPLCNISVLQYRIFKIPFAQLYRAKVVLSEETFRPEYILILGFANLVIQVMPPLPDNGITRQIGDRRPVLEIYPGSFFDDLQRRPYIGFSTIDLSSRITVQSDEQLHFSYEDGDFNILA